MSNKPILNVEVKRIITDLEAISLQNRYELVKRNLQNVSLSKIKKICMQAWKCEEHELIGKINHNNDLDRMRRFSFLWACYMFSNLDSSDIAKYQGCYYKTVSTAFEIGSSELKRSRKFYKTYESILAVLRATCPGRFENISKIDFSMINGVEDGFRELKIANIEFSKEKIAKIELKDRIWFYTNYLKSDLLALSLCGTECKLITLSQFSRPSDHELLFLMQGQGYRFILCKELFNAFILEMKKRTETHLENTRKQLEITKEVLERSNKKMQSSAEVKEVEKSFSYQKISYQEVVKLAFDILTEDAISQIAINTLIRAKSIYKNIRDLTFLMPLKEGLEFEIA